jgi:hypothetical protein
MATLLSELETRVRAQLVGPAATDLFWTSAELIVLLNNGIRDLYSAILQLNQRHFRTIDATNVTMAASATQLSGVPTDVLLVHKIRPRVLSERPNLKFVHRDYCGPDFESALCAGTVSADSGGVIYYDVQDAGAPVAAPVILVAPAMSSTLNLTLIYAPVLADRTSAQANPIPGESDDALVYWTLAHCIAKQAEKNEPDPGNLIKYATEKGKILVNLQPRDDSEPRYTEAVFEDEWSY